MKRRTFSLLAGTSMLALAGTSRRAAAQSAADFATLSKTTLTPLGSERAGNVAGTIPAWTGGFTTVPADWDPSSQIVPDFWSGESPLYTVNASNLSQYASLLSDGVKSLIQNTGLSLQVFPTHRTAAAPQWVYDNIVANSTRAQLNEADGRTGFTGAYGGIPFPMPDTSNPLSAGAQIIWNHRCRWQAPANTQIGASVVSNNGSITLAGGGITQNDYPYYDPNGSLATYQGYQYMNHETLIAPATSIGTQVLDRFATNSLQNPDILWELLSGQGRVRKAPELKYDTPSSFTDGIASFDEYNGFDGALDRYDWKLIGKQEMLIPYNNNAMRRAAISDVHMPKFLNPEIVRWELHRVWVVDATLHAGERHVIPHRRLFVDEDTYTVALADEWDANGNLYKEAMTFNVVFPNLPGTIMLNSMVYNLQTGDYVTITGPWGNAPYNKPESFAPIPASDLEPQAMAAAASY
jgi:hypothetical protein